MAGSGIEMLKLVLKDLCLRGILNIESRSIIVDQRYLKYRNRLFFTRGSNFQSYSTCSQAEEFFLKLFEKRHECQFYIIRRHVKKELDKIAFDNLVYKDLRKKGLCFFKIFPSPKAIRERNLITQKVEELDSKFDSLLEHKPEEFARRVKELGSHILFLNEENLKKLQSHSELLKKIGFAELSRSFNSDLFTSIALFSSFDISGGFGDAGGFDGFGGGDFGGGGAMGDW